MAFKAVNEYGMDVDLARKMEAKYDKDLEEDVQEWIGELLDMPFTKPFGETLQNGVVLCELANRILPGSIPVINRTGGLFKMQENITAFIQLCRKIGVPETSLFTTEALAQLKDMNQVLITINAFSNTLQRRKSELQISFNGPWLGPPISNAAKAPKKTMRKTNLKKADPGLGLFAMGSSAVMDTTQNDRARDQFMQAKGVKKNLPKSKNVKAVNEYGLDAELAQKMADKYDHELENKIQIWMEKLLGVTFDKEFGEMIKDGILLCEMVNKMLPGRIKIINRTGGLFRMQENITNFIRVCREIGVPEPSLFPTESLAQLKDVGQVLVTINAFSLQVQKRKTQLGTPFNGPFLGPPLNGKNKTRASRAVANVKKATGDNYGLGLFATGSAKTMEPSRKTFVRDDIKEKKLAGDGARGEVSKMNNGSLGMDISKDIDPREKIKRGLW